MVAAELREVATERRARWLWSLLPLLAGLTILPVLARYLPFGWNRSVAILIMRHDRWDCLDADRPPQTWQTLASDWQLLAGDKANAKVSAGRRSLAGGNP